MVSNHVLFFAMSIIGNIYKPSTEGKENVVFFGPDCASLLRGWERECSSHMNLARVSLN